VKISVPLTADQTAELFTRKLLAREPFVHVRFGDADYDWMMGGSGHTCDGEFPRAGIGGELLRAWHQLWAHPQFFLGDIATFGTPAAPAIREYAAQLVANQDGARLVHTEALLIHRHSEALVEFYRTLRADKRRKVLVGPLRLVEGAGLLASGMVSVHETTANTDVDRVLDRIGGMAWEVLLTACGRASKLIAGELATRYPERTIIELGSGLDPLFVGRTRSEQLPMHVAKSAVSGDVVDVAICQ
jgi:hypothetical protein